MFERIKFFFESYNYVNILGLTLSVSAITIFATLYSDQKSTLHSEIEHFKQESDSLKNHIIALEHENFNLQDQNHTLEAKIRKQHTDIREVKHLLRSQDQVINKINYVIKVDKQGLVDSIDKLKIKLFRQEDELNKSKEMLKQLKEEQRILENQQSQDISNDSMILIGHCPETMIENMSYSITAVIFNNSTFYNDVIHDISEAQDITIESVKRSSKTQSLIAKNSDYRLSITFDSDKFRLLGDSSKIIQNGTITDKSNWHHWSVKALHLGKSKIHMNMETKEKGKWVQHSAPQTFSVTVTPNVNNIFAKYWNLLWDNPELGVSQIVIPGFTFFFGLLYRDFQRKANSSENEDLRKQLIEKQMEVLQLKSEQQIPLKDTLKDKNNVENDEGSAINKT